MKKIDRTLMWLFAAAIIVSISWVLWFLLVVSTSSFDWIDLDKYGQFGDSFNALGVLFNGLALSFLVWTAVMQRKELSETKAALEKQANIQDTQLRLSKLPWISVEKVNKYDIDKNTWRFEIRLNFSESPALNISELTFYAGYRVDGEIIVDTINFYSVHDHAKDKTILFAFDGDEDSLNSYSINGSGISLEVQPLGIAFFEDSLKNLYELRLIWKEDTANNGNLRIDSPSLIGYSIERTKLINERKSILKEIFNNDINTGLEDN